jgi:hypothetical protein
MSSWKCNNCGLVNFANVEACRRCQTSANGGAPANSYGQGNFQLNRAPQPNHPQANNIAPPTSYQTGGLPTQYPQTPASSYPQGGNQQNPYAQGGDTPQSFGYAGNQPSSPNHNYQQNPGYQANNNYQQNDGYQQASGYAYNNGATNGLSNASQAYTNYGQTDYSHAAPYGAPSAGAYQQAYGAQGYGLWRDDKKLVMHKQAQLPDRCIKCNAPIHGLNLQRKLSWMNPVWFILMLFGIIGWIVFAILSATIKKKALVDMGLCEQHVTNRKNHMTVGWAAAIFGAVLIVMAFSMDKPLVILLGFVMLVVGAIIASMAANVVTVSKMDDNYIWLTRVNKDYLSNFPASGSF